MYKTYWEGGTSFQVYKITAVDPSQGCSFVGTTVGYSWVQGVEFNVCRDGYVGRSSDQTFQGYCDSRFTVAVAIDFSAQKCGPSDLNPCNVVSGRKIEYESDYAGIIPFQRTYNSMIFLDNKSSSLGRGWQHNYTEHLFTINNIAAGTSFVTHWVSGIGNIVALNSPSPGFYESDDKEIYLKEVDGTFVATLRGGTVKVFDFAGRLMQIKEFDGPVITLQYQNELLEKVNNEYGHEISLTYTSENLLDTILLPDLKTIRFEYLENVSNNIILPAKLIKVIYPDGNSRQYQYEDPDFPDALTGIIDENGDSYAQFTYNQYGLVATSQHTGGSGAGTISYGSNSTGGVAQIDFNDTGIKQYYFDGRRNISKIVENGITTEYSYSVAGSVLQGVTDSDGNITSYNYDINTNQLISVVEYKNTVNSKTTVYEYLSAESPLRTSIIVTDFYGNTESTTIEYNALNQPIKVTRQGTDIGGATISEVSEMQFDNFGRIIFTDGPRTDVTDTTLYTYFACATGSECGQLKMLTNALGHTIEYLAYSPHGLPTQLKLSNGEIVNYQYDDRLRVIQIQTSSVDNLNRTVNYTYDNFGQQTQLNINGLYSVTNSYNNIHQLTRKTDSLGNYIEYSYDVKGRKIAENKHDPADSLKNSIEYQYNVNNNVSQFKNGQNITDYIYAVNGKLDKVISGDQETAYEFDPLSRLTKIIDPLQGETSFNYNSLDLFTTVIDPKAKTSSYDNDTFGRLMRLTSPNTSITNFSYDNGGNLLTKIDNQSAVTFTYDALNRISALSYSNVMENVVFNYDDISGENKGVGRLTSVTDISGSTSYIYNGFGQVIKETRIIDGKTFITEYQYDSNSQLIGIILPSGSVLTYVLDSFARISSMSLTKDGLSQTIASNISYLPFGPLDSLTYGNSLAMTQSFDLSYRMIDKTVTGINQLSYSYDSNNNILAITDSLDSSKNQSLTYDKLSQLLTANGSYGNLVFTYDSVGNRLSKTDSNGVDTYVYATDSHHLNAIAGTTNLSFTYDGVGNTLTKGDLNFAYNQRGRLEGVSGNGTNTSYVYNYRGERVSKLVDGIKTYFIYDLQGQLIAESDVNGDIITEYVYLNGQLLAMVNASSLPPVTEEVIIDNEEIGTSSTGNWTLKNDNNNEAYGSNFRLGGAGTTRTYQWTPQLTSDNYEVYAYWKARFNLSNNVPFTIFHSGITDSVNVNQQINGTQWNMLGTYNFNGDGSEFIEVSNINGNAVADAVRFVQVGTTQTESFDLTFIHTDHLGAPTLLTNSVGTVIWRAEYSPYGKASVNNDVDGDGILATMNLRLPGQYFDLETGLHYNFFRDYDPEIGRYIESDPIGLDGGINTYIYVGSNPINSIDPSGLAEVWIGGVGDGSTNIVSDYYNRYNRNNPGITRRYFEWNNTKKILKYLKNLRKDNACEPINLIGHSYGGSDATRVAEKLRKAGIDVNLLITVDPVSRSWSKPDDLSNVSTWININANPANENASDTTAWWGGKWGDWTNGRSSTYYDATYNHEQFGSMMNFKHNNKNAISVLNQLSGNCICID